jgi:signal transduction histidine kinase
VLLEKGFMLDILLVEDDKLNSRKLDAWLNNKGINDANIDTSSLLELDEKLKQDKQYDLIVVSELDVQNKVNKRVDSKGKNPPLIITAEEVSSDNSSNGAKIQAVGLPADNPPYQTIAKNQTKLEQELARKDRSLQIAHERLNQFAYVLSHDLRAPVASILGLIQLVKASTSEDDENASYFNMMNTAAAELDSLFKSLLDLLVFQSDVSVEPGLVDLSMVLDEVKQGKSLELNEANGVVMEADFKDAPHVVYPEAIVKSVLQQLIGNSIKFRSTRRQLVLEISSVPFGEYNCVIVSDNGLGMDMDNVQQRLFQPFKRFHGNNKGKGVGLYLVKSMVEELGGFIEVESEINVGSTFKVYLQNQVR